MRIRQFLLYWIKKNHELLCAPVRKQVVPVRRIRVVGKPGLYWFLDTWLVSATIPPTYPLPVTTNTTPTGRQSLPVIKHLSQMIQSGLIFHISKTFQSFGIYIFLFQPFISSLNPGFSKQCYSTIKGLTRSSQWVNESLWSISENDQLSPKSAQHHSAIYVLAYNKRLFDVILIIWPPQAQTSSIIVSRNLSQ